MLPDAFVAQTSPKEKYIQFIWSSQEGWPIKFASDNVETLLGYSVSDFYDSKITFSDIIYQEDFERQQKDLEDCLKPDVPICEQIYRLQTQDGEVLTFRAYIFPNCDEQRPPAFFQGLFFNVPTSSQGNSTSSASQAATTASNLISPDVEKYLTPEQRTQILHFNKLAGIGKSTAAYVHEIKNPMQSILGCLDLAEEAIADGRSVNVYFQVARNAVERVTNILDGIQQISRPTRQRRELSDVGKLLEKEITLTEHRTRKNDITVALHIPEQIKPIWCIPDQIEQVFLNIIINALDAIESQENGRDGQLEITLLETLHPEGVEISFTDNGPGISREQCKHLFDAFYTTKSQGTGLGLPISKSIIQAHGGWIAVSSTLGQGSTFRIWLPRSLR